MARAAVVGLGSRAEMWVRGLAARDALVAFCDTNGDSIHARYVTAALAGVRAVVTGLAANESIAEQCTVDSAAQLADILDPAPVREA